tara:strand:+ start:249 stop:443 length:195 start_codon:yes stop_codon:yes gene_type:complete
MIKNEQNKLSLPFCFLSFHQASLGCLLDIYKNKLNNWSILSVHIILSTPFIWLFLLTKPGEKNA